MFIDSRSVLLLPLAAFALAAATRCSAEALELRGISVTPHLMLDSMRYRHAPEPADGARVQLFLYNGAADGSEPLRLDAQTRVVFNGESPATWLDKDAWAWHDMPSAMPDEQVSLPPGGLTVWTFNGRKPPFGPGGRIRIAVGPRRRPWLSTRLALESPRWWLSAITFLGPDDSIHPDSMIVHIANGSGEPVAVRSCRLWLPERGDNPRVLFPGEALTDLRFFGGRDVIAGLDRGGFRVSTGALPLTYTVVEVELVTGDGSCHSVWGHVRVKPERFNISGGWVNDGGKRLTHEAFLKALKRIHVDTAHIKHTPGYSDTELYDRYPLKYFGDLRPFETYDTDEMLARIHAAEFLGEPQYGGGTPVPPQRVWEELHSYTKTRLATTLTHSEERVWRDYAGLSDFPHYDAYRVTAPSADVWRMYDRWGDMRIGWGAPLETIGDMSRSLRELNRPMPCAYWSQGPHSGWGVYGGRQRTSPTPDEIRLQAYHAVATRITSLYWFNLSLQTLVQWRDTIDELGRIGRELRMLAPFLLEGDAYEHVRGSRDGVTLDWDTASVCGPRAALLFALDLDYAPDPDERVFVFGAPRAAHWRFHLPGYLRDVTDVFRVDADGVYDADWSADDVGVEISDEASRVAIYVATPDPSLRAEFAARHSALVDAEAALDFDPARRDADFEQLVRIFESD